MVTLSDDSPISFVNIPNKVIGMVTHLTTNLVYKKIILNLNHPFTQWIDRVLQVYFSSKQDLINKKAVERLIYLTDDVIRYPTLNFEEFNKYLERWREIPNLPSELRPPEIKKDDIMDTSYEKHLLNKLYREHKQRKVSGKKKKDNIKPKKRT